MEANHALKSVSIKKWFKEIKLKRKEEQRLQRAEVHAALSVAGVAAALAAIAAENSKEESNEDRDAAIASAAALVASQCAKVAEAMGAKKEQLSSVIGSAMSGTSTASDILTLTAAAATCNLFIFTHLFKRFYFSDVLFEYFNWTSILDIIRLVYLKTLVDNFLLLTYLFYLFLILF